MVTRPAGAPPVRYVAPCPALRYDGPGQFLACGSKERYRRTIPDGATVDEQRTIVVTCALCGHELHRFDKPPRP